MTDSLKDSFNLEISDLKLKVDGADATDTNLIAGKDVRISGSVEINGKKSDHEFFCDGTLIKEQDPTDSAKELAKEITQMILEYTSTQKIEIPISSFKTNNKVDELKSEIVKFIKSKMTDSLKDSFNLEISDLKLKVDGADATDTNLIAGKDVRISGSVEINGKKSDHEFSCKISLT